MRHWFRKTAVCLRILAIGVTPGTVNYTVAMNPYNPISWSFILPYSLIIVFWHGLHTFPQLLDELRDTMNYKKYRAIRRDLIDGNLHHPKD